MQGPQEGDPWGPPRSAQQMERPGTGCIRPEEGTLSLICTKLPHGVTGPWIPKGHTTAMGAPVESPAPALQILTT